MTLAAFVIFLLGALLEILWLWDAAHPRAAAGPRLAFLPDFLRPLQWLQAALTAAAGLLVGLFYLLGVAGVQVSLDDGPVFSIFVGLGLFVFAFGVVADGLLPRVSEQSILVAQLLVMLNAFLAGAGALPPLVWLLVLGLPAGLSLTLALSPRAPRPLLKAFVYLWYLASLLVFSVQNGAADFFSTPSLPEGSAFVFGTTFIFLLLHGLFAIRFFLIVSSLIVPRNRPLVAQVMPRLFADDQVPPLRYALFAVGLAALVALNAWLNLVPRAVLFNLAVVASVQLFFRPQRGHHHRDTEAQS